MLINPFGEQLTSLGDIMFRRVTTSNTINDTTILEMGEWVFGPGENFLGLKGVVILKNNRNFGVNIFSKFYYKQAA